MQSLQSTNSELQEVFIEEMHHRFYNSLQVLASLTQMLSRQDAEPDVRQRTIAELQARVAVLGRLHRLLAEPHGDDIQQSCRALCRTLAAAFDRNDARISMLVPARPVPSGVARGVMLLLAELVTNAMKHTQLDQPLDIEVKLDCLGDACELMVISAGQPRYVTRGKRPRMASELAERLGGTMQVDAGRIYTVHVRLPIPPEHLDQSAPRQSWTEGSRSI